MLETLAAEDDEDALMVLQFEDSIAETVQADSELSAFFSSYQEARKRLSEKTRYRGFWGVSRKGSDAKGYGKKGKSSKGKGKGGLERRIANSYCRICWKKGHWKNECPMKPGSSGGSSTSSTMSPSIPTSYVTVEEVPDELIQLEAIDESLSLHQQEVWCFVASNKPVDNDNSHRRITMNNSENFGVRRVFGAKQKLMSRFGHLVNLSKTFRKAPHSESLDRPTPSVREENIGDAQEHRLEILKPPTQECSHASLINECHFASSGTIGVVDLGASQTVIGSQQVGELLNQLPWQVKQQVKRTQCHLVFRFGDHQTLVSRHALVLPLGSENFRIAVVDGKTPFLLSNTFLKGIQAVIDTHEGTLWSKKLGRYLNIEPSSKNLFLMDINQLWEVTGNFCESPELVGNSGNADCHIMETKTEEKSEAAEDHEHAKKQEETGHNPKLETPREESRAAVTETISIVNETITKGPKIFSEVSESLSSFESRHVQDAQGKCVAKALTVSSGGLGGRECRSQEGDSKYESGRVVGDDHRIRQSQVGSQVPHRIRRPSLDRLVRGTIRKQSQRSPSKIRGLCGETSRCRSSSRTKGEVEGSTEAKAQECCEDNSIGELMDSGAPNRLRGRGGHDRTSTGLFEQPSPDREHPGAVGLCVDRESQSGTPYGTDGDGDERSGHASEAAEHQARALISEAKMESQLIRSETQQGVDNDFVFHSQGESHQQSYHRIIQKKVRQFQQELRECVEQAQKKKSLGARCDLIEIMCSENSELTFQVHQAGGKALRFGLSQGDLQHKESRLKLFNMLAMFRPKNVWFSPECRPWCLWSGYNMSKSEDLLRKILNDRLQSMWQISLGIVLLQHQVRNGCHFHMEQPNGSQMWNVHGAQVIVQETFRCCFDLCRVGQLKDPQFQVPIRKRLVVQTTSEVLYRELHGKLCKNDHQHKTIEGSTVVKGQRMSLSTFTERYPSKFAKQIVRILLKEKVRVGFPICVGETEEHPTKRRRLFNKLSPAAIEESFPDVNWQTVMEKVNRVTPRVGTKVFEHGDIIDTIQKLCPKHLIQHVVVCRGMDRYVGPCQPTPKGKAPLRRFICIRRRTEEIVVEPEWEPWEHLSLAKIRRKCTPARVGLTIFAQAKRQKILKRIR